MSEIYRPKQLANFRQIVKPRHKNSRWREDRDGMDEGHLSAVRQLPCTVCLRVPAGEAHHLKSATGERGMSVRSTDKWTVPMCRVHHDEVERAGTRNEARYFKENAGCDPLELATALWSNTGDVARMTKVLLANRNVLKRKD